MTGILTALYSAGRAMLSSPRWRTRLTWAHRLGVLCVWYANDPLPEVRSKAVEGAGRAAMYWRALTHDPVARRGWGIVSGHVTPQTELLRVCRYTSDHSSAVDEVEVLVKGDERAFFAVYYPSADANRKLLWADPDDYPTEAGVRYEWTRYWADCWGRREQHLPPPSN